MPAAASPAQSPPASSRPADPRTGETRQRIVDASLRLFAEHGFKGVSVRDISTEAGVNVAAIGYHFGGKRGLYRTIFETVLDEDESLFVERIGTVERLLARAQGDRAMLSAAVEILVAGLVGRIFAYEHAHWFGVLLARELALPDELFELIYRRRAEPLLGAMTRVTAAATGVGADDPAARLAANLLHGQVGNLVFARPLLWRQLGWEGSTPGQAELLTRTIVDLICRSLGLPTPPRPGQGDPT